MIKLENLEIAWEKSSGLLPAIIQNALTSKVLMLGYMNREALEKTLLTKKVTFWSRSKKSIWIKGESSGNYFHLVDIKIDCDNDTFLVSVQPEGPACHRDTLSCFDNESSNEKNFNLYQILNDLEIKIQHRVTTLPNSSYTASLVRNGINKICQKVGEEATETIIAALTESKEFFLNECADLIYHFLVLLYAKGFTFNDVLTILNER